MKKVQIEKGVSVPRGKETEMKKKAGGSNVGKYKTVAPSEFAGGGKSGAPKGSYPINTRKRAKAALAYAHNAPNPGAIKAKVHSKYPDLGKPEKKSK